MNKKIIILFPIFLVLLFGCNNNKQTESETAIINSTDSNQIEIVEKQFSLNNHLTMAVLFHQKAAEYEALCYQAFNTAKLMLDKDLEDQSIDKKRAVVLDIDETILDNSPYEAKCILEDVNYPAYWSDWCNLENAKALPGSVDFLDYVINNNVDVYYITNRKIELLKATKNNLLKHGFPIIDDNHIMMQTKTSSKEFRRRTILENHHISLLIGDNLNDFMECFENVSIDERKKLTEKYKYEFGRRFIIIPNAMYGEWEGAIYDNNYKIPDDEKAKKRFESITGF
ncbi:MAG: 5'-nucleotidase, lipoprotein e(P4) family [Saprospiraceae bacterium]|nr:5'-nucleotidase, lipoprotein e(P4) family [Saprospiraceae bacterium]